MRGGGGWGLLGGVEGRERGQRGQGGGRGVSWCDIREFSLHGGKNRRLNHVPELSHRRVNVLCRERENNSTFHFANTAAGLVVSSPVYRRAMKMALSMEQCTLLSLVKLLIFNSHELAIMLIHSHAYIHIVKYNST